MPKILFVRDAELHELRPGEPRYKAGDIRTMSIGSALHWKKRGKAVNAPKDEPAAAVHREAIVVRVDNTEDRTHVYVESAWPAASLIDVAAFADAPYMTIGDGEIDIMVDNGLATYRKTGETTTGEWEIELVTSTYDPVPRSDDPTPIPEDWKSLHWMKRVKLAKDLVGDFTVPDDRKEVEVADEMIAAEIARRAAQ
ncbi:MAG: hypothetical protein KF723_22110 [Rhizobiaceae bacterium]|nr:hypothetical protein [Rhizobiaceae bacterium]